MAIVRMISRDPAEFRQFQQRMVTVGKIRLGVYNGRYPEKIDTFRFTSTDEAKVRALADAYGGTAEQWTPQGGGKPQWEVVSEAKELPVRIVNGQNVEPWYEAWGSGRTCIRRCDGEINKIDNTPCVCNGPDRPDPKKLCKPTIRVQLMLPELPGVASWLLESHGENACAEIAPLGPFVAIAPMAVPAVLRLREETRREWSPEKRKFETRSFYVPWLDISEITAHQIGAGGAVLRQALVTAGGSAAIGGTVRQAIEAAPTVAEPAAPAVLADEERQRILAAIEGATSVPYLDGIRSKLKERGISDKAVVDAWKSKMAGIKAAEALASVTPDDLADAVDQLDPAARERLREMVAPQPMTAEQEAAHARQQSIDAAMEGGREFFADELTQYDEAIARGATHAAIVEAGGPVHWLATDDQARAYVEPEPTGYAVGDTVTVGGIGFTKVAEMPTVEQYFEGTVEDGTQPTMPQVPAGNYDPDELWASLTYGAGLRTPPLTTDGLKTLICNAFGLTSVQQATGEQLARFKAGMKAGVV